MLQPEEELPIGLRLDPSGPVSDLPDSGIEKAKQLPDPATFYLLCHMPDAPKAYESGILKADTSVNFEELLSPVLFVVKVGPDAFNNEKLFPTGPACKEGDFIIVRPNTGTRLRIHGREFRVIRDESVEAVVQDPRGISRL